ncbi:hypothetical protein GOBAR_DD35023 [Gossypium barbadense]|nr:hypothetical protein GOBAR_DD35023 [Gossypium barbadense]
MEDALENLRLLDDEEEALQEHDGALLGHGESYCPLRLSIDPSKIVFGWDLSIRAVARNRSRVASRWLRAADGSPSNDENWAGFTQGNLGSVHSRGVDNLNKGSDGCIDARPEDVLVWKHEGSGEFTVRSGYRVLFTERNKLVHEGVKFSMSKVLGFIRGYDHDTWLVNKNPLLSSGCRGKDIWRPPESDIIKLNFDASYLPEKKIAITAKHELAKGRYYSRV